MKPKADSVSFGRLFSCYLREIAYQVHICMETPFVMDGHVDSFVTHQQQQRSSSTAAVLQQRQQQQCRLNTSTYSLQYNELLHNPLMLHQAIGSLAC